MWNEILKITSRQKNFESLFFTHVKIEQRQSRNVWSGIVIEQAKLKCEAAVVGGGNIKIAKFPDDVPVICNVRYRAV